MWKLKRSMLVFAAYGLVCVVGAATRAEEAKNPIRLPVGTLRAAELRALFSDRTVESITAENDRVSLSYYDPGGEVRQARHGQTRTGRWRVTDMDRICLQMEDLPEKCRIVVKEDDTFKKYIVKKNGRHQHSVTYRRFWEGNPFDL